MELQDFIKGVRKAAHLTKAQFSRVVGVDPSMVTRWENGDSSITRGRKTHIIDLFRVNPQWIETGERPVLLAPYDPDEDYPDPPRSKFADNGLTGEFALAFEIFKSLPEEQKNVFLKILDNLTFTLRYGDASNKQAFSRPKKSATPQDPEPKTDDEPQE